jgi:mono/diheme cytochrome c family protein
MHDLQLTRRKIEEVNMKINVVGLAVAALAAGGVLAVVSAPRPAGALPQYAAQTGKSCGACHVNAAGGGPRNGFGQAFAANGHKLPTGATANKQKGPPATGASTATPAVAPVSTSDAADRVPRCFDSVIRYPSPPCY